MKHNDCQYGIPFCEYNDTKANIESITGLSEGCIAYATDTNQLGIYTGATWTWIASSGGIMYHGEYESDPTGTSPSSGDEYFYDLEKRMQVYIDGEWRELNGAMRFQFTDESYFELTDDIYYQLTDGIYYRPGDGVYFE